jgi:hypothetical protein
MDDPIPSVFVTGYAMMPKQHYIWGTQPLVIVAIEINPQTGEILRADWNLSIELYR